MQPSEGAPFGVAKRGYALPSQDEERRLRTEGFFRVAGIDEVGRGPIAGPVVAAAVILPDLGRIGLPDGHLIRDSKTLSSRQLVRADALIRGLALAFAIGESSSGEIDHLGIAPATRQAMRRALDQLDEPPSHLLVDAFPLDWRHVPCTPIVKGDALCTSISAASIIAKTYRDEVMRGFDTQFPGYGFAAHKGYASSEHLSNVRGKGPSPIHRMTFSPFKPTLFDIGAKHH